MGKESWKVSCQILHELWNVFKLSQKMHLTSVEQVKYFVFSIFRRSIECLNTCQSTAWQRKRKEFGLLVFGWVFFLCQYGYWSTHCLATQENDFVQTVLVCVVFPQLLFIPSLLTLVLGRWGLWHGLGTAAWELLLFQKDVGWHAAPGTANQPFRRHLSAKVTWCHKVPRAGQLLVAWAGDLCDSEGSLKRKA